MFFRSLIVIPIIPIAVGKGRDLNLINISYEKLNFKLTVKQSGPWDKMSMPRIVE